MSIFIRKHTRVERYMLAYLNCLIAYIITKCKYFLPTLLNATIRYEDIKASQTLISRFSVNCFKAMSIVKSENLTDSWTMLFKSHKRP